MSGILEAGIAIYVAMAVALSVWITLFIYLWRIDAQARELKRRLDQQPTAQERTLPNATITRVSDEMQEPVEK
jgi:CcmD family protein